MANSPMYDRVEILHEEDVSAEITRKKTGSYLSVRIFRPFVKPGQLEASLTAWLCNRRQIKAAIKLLEQAEKAFEKAGVP